MREKIYPNQNLTAFLWFGDLIRKKAYKLYISSSCFMENLLVKYKNMVSKFELYAITRAWKLQSNKALNVDK